SVSYFELAPQGDGLGEEQACIEREDIDRQAFTRDQVNEDAPLGAETRGKRETRCISVRGPAEHLDWLGVLQDAGPPSEGLRCGRAGRVPADRLRALHRLIANPGVTGVHRLLRPFRRFRSPGSLPLRGPKNKKAREPCSRACGLWYLLVS